MKIKNLPDEVKYQIGMGKISADDADAIAYKKKFQQRLNYFKQKKLIEMTDELFFKPFINGKGDKTLNNIIGQKPSANFFCNLSLKDLGITKREIIASCVARQKD